MTTWHNVCITDKTGVQFFKCTASPMSTASEIKNLQGHIKRAQKNPKAYAFLDVASAIVLLDNVPYGPCGQSSELDADYRLDADALLRELGL